MTDQYRNNLASEFALPNYNMFPANLASDQGRGIIVYIRNNLEARPTALHTTFAEYNDISFTLQKKKTPLSPAFTGVHVAVELAKIKNRNLTTLLLPQEICNMKPGNRW